MTEKEFSDKLLGNTTPQFATFLVLIVLNEVTIIGISSSAVWTLLSFRSATLALVVVIVRLGATTLVLSIQGPVPNSPLCIEMIIPGVRDPGRLPAGTAVSRIGDSRA
jgi:hypothetical protein